MALTRCAALDVAPYGIRVNAVAPSLAMHPFLAKVTSDELLAELKQREAFGRAAEPWEVANVMVFLASRLLVVPDRRGHLGVESASVTTSTRADRRPAATSCCRSRQSCSRPRASRTRRSATSPTPPASCAAASITTSTPRSRWSTRSCRRSRTSCSARTRDPRRRATTRAPSSRPPCGCRSRRSTTTATRWRSSRTRPSTSARSTGSPTCAERNQQSRDMWLTLLREGVSAGALRRTSTSSWSTASSATPYGWRCAGTAPAPSSADHDVADQYLTILLDGITS